MSWLFETCFTKSPWFGRVHCHSENKIALLGRIPPISDTPTILLIICNIPLIHLFPHQNDSVVTRQTQEDHPGTQQVSEHVSPFHPLKGGSLKPPAASAGKMAIQGPMISL